jgi:hypothetical protein
MHPETPFESWLSNNCPDVTATRVEDLPPDVLAVLAQVIGANLHTMPQALKDNFASFLAEQLQDDASPEDLEAAASLLQRLGLRVH